MEQPTLFFIFLTLASISPWSSWSCDLLANTFETKKSSFFWGFEWPYFYLVFCLISFRVLATYFSSVMRWVHSEWFLMRLVFYVTELLLSWFSWGTKGGIGYLLPQQWNNGLQLFTKAKCYFQDDEGPFVIMGILATRSFSDHTSLTSTFNLFCFLSLISL